jgi:hypothetical protein
MKITESVVNGIIIRKYEEEESDLTTDSEKQSRIDVCNSCENFSNGSCSLCGCILETLLLHRDKHCPINKW